MNEPQSGRRVLIVDDEPVNAEMLARRLRNEGYDIALAASAREAQSEIEKSPFDLLLLDLAMPDASGLDFLASLRANPKTETIPVIMVSALDDTQSMVKALDLGANDYVSKPINLAILLARMETQLRLAGLVKRLERQNAILTTLAAYDELTGVYNRRALGAMLESELVRAARHGRNVSAMMLDLDRFKRVNDKWGHQAGDQVLRQFAGRAMASLRGADALFRYGGEEFLAILPETGAAESMAVAERCRGNMAAKPFLAGGESVLVTVSIGVATSTPAARLSSSQLIEQADKALYAAKMAGRNRVFHMDAEQNRGEPAAAGAPATVRKHDKGE